LASIGFSRSVFARHLDGGTCAGLAATMLETLSMAVYTDVAAEDLALFLAGYDIGELLSYKGIAEGVENSNFLVHTGRGYFILTLYERRVAERDLPFFLALMEHLASRGITCPQPVKNRAGERPALRRLG
jgi:Ser/Thr protein kinase RdoA (MazF antagonist)